MKKEINSSILAREIPRTEEPGRLWYVGSRESLTLLGMRACIITIAVYGLDGIRHVACLQNVVLDVMNFSSYHLKPALLTEFLKNKKTFGKKWKEEKRKKKKAEAPLKRTLFVCVLEKRKPFYEYIVKSFTELYCRRRKPF